MEDEFEELTKNKVRLNSNTTKCVHNIRYLSWWPPISKTFITIQIVYFLSSFITDLIFFSFKEGNISWLQRFNISMYIKLWCGLE